MGWLRWLRPESFSESPSTVQGGVTKEELKLNIRPLLRLVCKKFFGEFTGKKLVVITISSTCILGTLL